MRRTTILLLLMLTGSSAIAGMDSTSVSRPPVNTSSLKSDAGTGLSAVVAPLEGKTIVCKTTSTGKFTSGKVLYWGAAKVQGGKIYTLASPGSYSLQPGTRQTGRLPGKVAEYVVMKGGNGSTGYKTQAIADATGITVWSKSIYVDNICGDPTLCPGQTREVTSVGCTMPWPNT